MRLLKNLYEFLLKAYDANITKHLSTKLWGNEAWSLCSSWYLTSHSVVSPLSDFISNFIFIIWHRKEYELEAVK